MVWGPTADGSEGTRYSGHLTPTRAAAAADRVGAVGVDGTDPEGVELGAEGVGGIDDGSLTRMRPGRCEDHCSRHPGVLEVVEGVERCTSEGPRDLERSRNGQDPISDLKQNGTQEKTSFSGTVFNTFSHGVVLFVASGSSKKNLLTG